jgi:hypothetical protein
MDHFNDLEMSDLWQALADLPGHVEIYWENSLSSAKVSILLFSGTLCYVFIHCTHVTPAWSTRFDLRQIVLSILIITNNVFMINIITLFCFSKKKKIGCGGEEEEDTISLGVDIYLPFDILQ